MPKKSRHPSLRIAVAGIGEVARRNYLPFLADQPGVALACWNRTVEKAGAAAREFGGEACPTLAALMAWRPTAVLVLTAETCRQEMGTKLIRLGAYLQTLRARTAPPVPGVDGLRELQVEAALRRSIREGRPVRLAREFPL
jgi:hypothetical protein